MNKIHKTCKCGKEFWVKPSLNRVKSCSRSCARKGSTTSDRQKLITSERMRNNKLTLGMSSWNKGLKGYMSGSSHYLWKSDRTLLLKYKDSIERNSPLYKRWRQQVWLRDNFTCKIANPDCSGRIEAHHILGWSSHPELRYKLNNGITLCHAHHPRARAEEKRLVPTFQGLVSVSK